MEQKNPAEMPKSESEQQQSFFRIATAAESTASLRASFAHVPRFKFLTSGDLQQADLLMIDGRTQALTALLSDAGVADLLQACGSLPIIVIVGQNTSVDVLLGELPAGIDPQRIELLSELEITSNLPLVRVSMLLQRATARHEEDVLRKNAHIVLQAVMQYSNDWMVLKSLDHRFLMVSRMFCEAYGKPAHEILGKNDLQIGTSSELVLGKPDTDWKGYWELDKKVTDSGEPVVLQPLVLSDKEGGETRETTDKVPLKNELGEVFGLLVCVSELERQTDYGAMDARQSNRTWERRKNLTESPALMELNKERKRAEALQQESERAVVAKNQFIAAASHDLRQPLHAVGLYIGALEARVDGDAQDLVDKIKNCIASLNELLTSLLDISRLDANVVSAKYSSFSLDDLLNSLVEECSRIASNRSIELSCFTDKSTVNSDPILLRRVVRNLLLNAINHTKEGSVSIRAQRVGNRVDLVVSDTGIGIPVDKQASVFDEFTKLETNNDAASNGLGLGLSIVKRLCLLLDIKLRLTSTPDVGTKVSLMIPLGKKTQDPDRAQNSREVSPAMGFGVATAASDESAKDRGLIVVIDDEMEVCEAVEIMLMRSGYAVVAATTPESAIRVLNEKNQIPDALLVDFRLARGVTGIEAINQINDEFKVSVPALIVTGDTSESGLRQITRSGRQFLHKPVEAEILLERVSMMLART